MLRAEQSQESRVTPWPQDWGSEPVSVQCVHLGDLEQAAVVTRLAVINKTGEPRGGYSVGKDFLVLICQEHALPRLCSQGPLSVGSSKSPGAGLLRFPL